jgi:hypothetical protein
MMQQSEGFFQAQEIVAGQCGVDALTLRLFSPDVEDLPLSHRSSIRNSLTGAKFGSIRKST